MDQLIKMDDLDKIAGCWVDPEDNEAGLEHLMMGDGYSPSYSLSDQEMWRRGY